MRRRCERSAVGGVFQPRRRSARQGLVALVLPPTAKLVIVLADNDVSGAGERAVRRAAARWLAEGRRVKIAMPPSPGTDMADMLLGRVFRSDEGCHVGA